MKSDDKKKKPIKPSVRPIVEPSEKKSEKDEAPLCACGCGEKVRKNYWGRKWNKFIFGHGKRNKPGATGKKHWNYGKDKYAEEKAKLAPLCACGCGNHVKWGKGKWNKYIAKHGCRKTKIKNSDLIVCCSWCNKSKKIFPYEYKIDKKYFCNNKCMGKWRSENKSGENNPNFGKDKYSEEKAKPAPLCACGCGTKVTWNQSTKKWNEFIHNHHLFGENNPNYIRHKKTVFCRYCKTPMKKQPSHLKNKFYFCNKTCKNKWNKENKIVVYCEWCGKRKETYFYSIKTNDHHFCSKECSAMWAKENSIGENHPQWKSLYISCSYCDAPKLIQPYRLKNSEKIFCNNVCYSKWMKGKKRTEIYYKPKNKLSKTITKKPTFTLNDMLN